MNTYEIERRAREKAFDEAVAEKLKIKAARRDTNRFESLIKIVDGVVYGPSGAVLGRASTNS